MYVCCLFVAQSFRKDWIIMMLEDEGGSAGQNILQESKGGYKGGIL